MQGQKKDAYERILQEVLQEVGKPNSPMRGAALGAAAEPDNPIDPLFEALVSQWVTIDGKCYPPWFAHSLGAYAADPVDVERMRVALSVIPRVDPQEYDILFNSETREWTIVKWVPLPQPIGYVGGLGGWLTETVLEAFDVYQIDARRRSPASLSDRDWLELRRRCTQLRDPGQIDREIYEHNMKVQGDNHALAAEFEHGLMEYYHKAIRREGEESGMAYATPEEMARKFGGSPEEWDPDTVTLD